MQRNRHKNDYLFLGYKYKYSYNIHDFIEKKKFKWS